MLNLSHNLIRYLPDLSSLQLLIELDLGLVVLLCMCQCVDHGVLVVVSRIDRSLVIGMCVYNDCDGGVFFC